MLRTLLRWAAVIPVVLSAGAARGEERYYAMIFGSQSSPKLLRYTHTWATFVRVVGEGDDLRSYQVYPHTISWLPESLAVRTWALLPEKGVNLDLYATLDAVYSRPRERDDVGPLRDGSTGLRAVVAREGDPRQRRCRVPGDQHPANLLVSDCIHAVAAVDPVFGRGHYPLIRIGKPASRFIADR